MLLLVSLYTAKIIKISFIEDKTPENIVFVVCNL